MCFTVCCHMSVVVGRSSKIALVFDPEFIHFWILGPKMPNPTASKLHFGFESFPIRLVLRFSMTPDTEKTSKHDWASFVFPFPLFFPCTRLWTIVWRGLGPIFCTFFWSKGQSQKSQLLNHNSKTQSLIPPLYKSESLIPPCPHILDIIKIVKNVRQIIVDASGGCVFNNVNNVLTQTSWDFCIYYVKKNPKMIYVYGVLMHM